MAKRLVEVATRNLNLCPVEKVISDTLSPLMIVTMGDAPNACAFSFDFGACIEMFE